jgi:hypothetical protein
MYAVHISVCVFFSVAIFLWISFNQSYLQYSVQFLLVLSVLPFFFGFLLTSLICNTQFSFIQCFQCCHLCLGFFYFVLFNQSYMRWSVQFLVFSVLSFFLRVPFDQSYTHYSAQFLYCFKFCPFLFDFLSATLVCSTQFSSFSDFSGVLQKKVPVKRSVFQLCIK